MAGSVNKVILIGNLGADPESRTTQKGGTVVTFSVATSESWTDKQSGEKRERTEWHRVVIYNETLAEIASRYLRKGSKVHLEGQLQTRKWQDQGGTDRTTTEIVLANYRGELTLLGDPRGAEPQEDRRQDTASPGRPARASQPRREPAMAGAGHSGGPVWDAPRGSGDLDDEIPF